MKSIHISSLNTIFQCIFQSYELSFCPKIQVFTMCRCQSYNKKQAVRPRGQKATVRFSPAGQPGIFQMSSNDSRIKLSAHSTPLVVQIVSKSISNVRKSDQSLNSIFNHISNISARYRQVILHWTANNVKDINNTNAFPNTSKSISVTNQNRN